MDCDLCTECRTCSKACQVFRHWPAAAAVPRVAAEVGTVVTISDIVIDTPETARAHRFPGSPTIRVRGRDLQPEVEERGDFGLG